MNQQAPAYHLPNDVQQELADLARLMSDTALHRAAWLGGRLLLRRSA